MRVFKNYRNNLKRLLRRALSSDAQDINAICLSSIRETACVDYSHKQISAWLTRVEKISWEDKISQQYFVIAELNDQIEGFISLNSTGCIDYLYVDPSKIRNGIASILLKEIVTRAKHNSMEYLWTMASKTAQPFFLKNGFAIKTTNEVDIDGVILQNARMERRLKEKSR